MILKSERGRTPHAEPAPRGSTVTFTIADDKVVMDVHLDPTVDPLEVAGFLNLVQSGQLRDFVTEQVATAPYDRSMIEPILKSITSRHGKPVVRPLVGIRHLNRT